MTRQEHRQEQNYFSKVQVFVSSLVFGLLMVLPFFIVWYTFYSDLVMFNLSHFATPVLVILYLIGVLVIANIYKAFYISISKISELIYSGFLAVLIVDIVAFIVMSMLIGFVPELTPYLLMVISQFILIIAWAYFSHKWYFAKNPPKRTVVVSNNQSEIEQLLLKYELGRRYEILERYSLQYCLDNLEECLGDMEAVFLPRNIEYADRNPILKYCVLNNVDCYVLPGIGDTLMQSGENIHLFHLPIVKVQRQKQGLMYQIVKRLTDILVSLIAIIITSPIMLVTAIVIKSYDGGDVFYKQTRLTKNGKEFDVIKFRSMCMDAEKDGVARLSSGENDNRITPVGKVIRSTRIDELPQLFNILKGDMSLVGPRPERPEIAAQYEKELPEFALRLQVKAGLTGNAQVYGKYNTTPKDKLLMDLMYIAKANIIEDLKICLATIKILFISDSTEGIEEGQTTASNESKEADKSTTFLMDKIEKIK